MFGHEYIIILFLSYKVNKSSLNAFKVSFKINCLAIILFLSYKVNKSSLDAFNLSFKINCLAMNISLLFYFFHIQRVTVARISFKINFVTQPWTYYYFLFLQSLNKCYVSQKPTSLLIIWIDKFYKKQYDDNHNTMSPFPTLWRQKCSTVVCFCGKIMYIKHKIKFIILIHYSPFNKKFKVHKITIWKQPINCSIVRFHK